MQQELARDVPHVGCRRDRLAESFHVGRDVYARYFLAIFPASEGTNHPFWITKELTSSNFDQSHLNSIQIQYWTLASIYYVDAETYIVWDSTNSNVWLENKRFELVWTHRDCIMDAWQSRIQEGTKNPQMQNFDITNYQH